MEASTFRDGRGTAQERREGGLPGLGGGMDARGMGRGLWGLVVGGLVGKGDR